MILINLNTCFKCYHQLMINEAQKQITYGKKRRKNNCSDKSLILLAFTFAFALYKRNYYNSHFKEYFTLSL